MSTTLTLTPIVSKFAQDVADGLAAGKRQKTLPSRYLYDDLGSALFEAITLLPEYGLTRADERVLSRFSTEIVQACPEVSVVCELGSGSGKKTRYLLEALRSGREFLTYVPIDVSKATLDICQKEVCDLADVRPVCADWMEGLSEVARTRTEDPLLLLFLGSTIGNLERACIPDFLKQIQGHLRPGDFFLLGADLVKDVETMLAAYDDPTGVTAAFNLNILGRINRELEANFDLRSFAHEARWNAIERRIEMHLLSCREQRVYIGALDRSFQIGAGETIWTESSHKFSERELDEFAKASGFAPLAKWVDLEWPLAEALWRVMS